MSIYLNLYKLVRSRGQSYSPSLAQPFRSLSSIQTGTVVQTTGQSESQQDLSLMPHQQILLFSSTWWTICGSMAGQTTLNTLNGIVSRVVHISGMHKATPWPNLYAIEILIKQGGSVQFEMLQYSMVEYDERLELDGCWPWNTKRIGQNALNCMIKRDDLEMMTFLHGKYYNVLPIQDSGLLLDLAINFWAFRIAEFRASPPMHQIFCIKIPKIRRPQIDI